MKFASLAAPCRGFAESHGRRMLAALERQELPRKVPMWPDAQSALSLEEVRALDHFQHQLQSYRDAEVVAELELPPEEEELASEMSDCTGALSSDGESD